MANTEANLTSTDSLNDFFAMDHDSFYGKMPYVLDSDLNVERIFTKVSGNVIKAYRCKIDDEPIEIKH